MNTKRIPFHETLHRDSRATQNRTQKQAHKKVSWNDCNFLPRYTQPRPCIYWCTITQFGEGGGRNFAKATMRTGEGQWTPSQLQILKTTKQKQNCSEAVLWTPGNKLPQNKQKPLQANNCPKIVPFFISLSLSLQTGLFVTLKRLLQHKEDYKRLVVKLCLDSFQ